MPSIYRRIELAANIAIVTVALLFGYVLIKRYLVLSPEVRATNSIQIGAKLSLQGHSWSGSDEHLVIVLQTKCHYCSESSRFYQRLVEQASDPRKLEIVAVLPESTNESGRYLSNLGLRITEVVQMDLSSLGVRATPTILLVNNDGVVTNLWTGKLPPEKESEVLNRLKANGAC